MKILRSKKGIAPMAVIAVALIVVFVFAGTGAAKFIFFTDKTVYILGGLFVALILFGKSKREGRF